MGKSVNKITLLGHLGQDPESKTLPNGTPLVTFSVATTETWKDKTSLEQRSKTEWHNCEAYGALASIISQYCKKGNQIYLEGSIAYRTYESEGVKKYATNIRVRELTLLGQREGSNQAAPQAASQASPSVDIKAFDDEIPF